MNKICSANQELSYYRQTKVDEDKDTVDYQTIGGKAEMQKAENLENGFSLSGTNSWSNRHTCANSGHFTVISSVLCRAENLDHDDDSFLLDCK